jgi:hypothetical protein
MSTNTAIEWTEILCTIRTRFDWVGGVAVVKASQPLEEFSNYSAPSAVREISSKTVDEPWHESAAYLPP